MKYSKVKALSDAQFYRLTGVKKETFEKMLTILKIEQKERKQRGGSKKNTIKLPDTLLMTLEYLRDYPTFLRLGISYGISESYACKLVCRTENTLIQSGEFSLPGKKSLFNNVKETDVLVIDATESPVQRPKKTTTTLFRKKEKAYVKDTSCY